MSDPLDLDRLDRALFTPSTTIESAPAEAAKDPFGWLLDDPAHGLAGHDPLDPLRIAADGIAADAASDRLDPRESRWRRDPAGWAKARIGASLWSKQITILEAVRDYHNVAVHTSHTVGKSFDGACAALWWIDVHPPGTAFVVTTAPSASQVRSILWREIGRLHSRSSEFGERLPGRINLTSEWYIGNELVALGRKPPDYRNDSFVGIHAIYVLVIFDEACGIPRVLWDAASTLTSNDDSRFLAIGNPDDADTVFGEVCGARPASVGGAAAEEYHIIHISSFDTPNFTGEKVPEEVSKSLVSVRWVEERKRVWGERSSIYQSKVLGKFPVDADDGAIPYSWAVACRHLEFPEGEPRVAGYDVAGTGSDRSVLRLRLGKRLAAERVWHETSDPTAHAMEVAVQLREWECDQVNIDAEGVGHGVAGELRRLSSRHNPTGINEVIHSAEVVAYRAATKASGKDFLNLRAEMYWQMRELVRLKLIDLSELDDDCIAELTAPRYEVVVGSGKIRIEPKDDLKRRLGLSPDRGEGVLLACWNARKSAFMPAPARVLTGQHYASASLVQPNDYGIAGPRTPKVEPIIEDTEEAALLRSLMASR